MNSAVVRPYWNATIGSESPVTMATRINTLFGRFRGHRLPYKEGSELICWYKSEGGSGGGKGSISS